MAKGSSTTRAEDKEWYRKVAEKLAAHGELALTELGGPKLGRRPAGKVKALLECQSQFILRQSETAPLMWFVRLAPGANAPAFGGEVLVSGVADGLAVSGVAAGAEAGVLRAEMEPILKVLGKLDDEAP